MVVPSLANLNRHTSPATMPLDSAETDGVLRAQISQILQDGLETLWQQRACDSESFNTIAAELSGLAPNDLSGKLRVAGFTLQAFADAGEGLVMACETCMYYEIHRQYCALPALKLPVKREWSCRMWRI